MENRLIRLKEVIRKVGISKANIYRRMGKQDFPSPVSLGANSVAWVESEVDAWIKSNISRRNAA